MADNTVTRGKTPVVPDGALGVLKVAITDPVEKRIAALKEDVTFLPEDSKKAKEEVKAAIIDCAVRILNAGKKVAKEYDTGRLIHTIDLLSEVMHTANAALMLPYTFELVSVPKTLPEMAVPRDENEAE